MAVYIKKPIVIVAIVLIVIRSLLWALNWYLGFERIGSAIFSFFSSSILTLLVSSIITLLIALIPIKNLNYKQKFLLILPYTVIVISILGILSTIQFIALDYQTKNLFGI